MKTITIAVGSKRGPKLNAVTEALGAFSAGLAQDARFEVVGVEVDSGVSHTPASRDELMRGARQRAQALIEKGRRDKADWQYFVGLEGGLDVVHEDTPTNELPRHSGLQQNGFRRVFLESWAYVSDGARGHYGHALRRKRRPSFPGRRGEIRFVAIRNGAAIRLLVCLHGRHRARPLGRRNIASLPCRGVPSLSTLARAGERRASIRRGKPACG